MTDSPILYVDMDDVLCDFTGAYQRDSDQHPEIHYPQSVPGFFEHLEPIDGAIQAVRELMDGFDVHVLTAPSRMNPHSYSEKRLWIEAQFGYEFTRKLIISPDKGLLKGDFLIDDRAKGNGQDRFDGELIQFGTDRFPGWNSVLEYLRPLAPC